MLRGEGLCDAEPANSGANNHAIDRGMADITIGDAVSDNLGRRYGGFLGDRAAESRAIPVSTVPLQGFGGGERE